MYVQRPRHVESKVGPFGHGYGSGYKMQAHLLRSALDIEPPDCHLIPHPRGALEDLKMMPMEKAHPGLGEVKVGNKYTLTMQT